MVALVAASILSFVMGLWVGAVFVQRMYEHEINKWKAKERAAWRSLAQSTLGPRASVRVTDVPLTKKPTADSREDG